MPTESLNTELDDRGASTQTAAMDGTDTKTADTCETSLQPPTGLHAGSFRWVLAGLIGIASAVGLMARNPLPALPPAVSALLATGAGWFVFLLCAPWGVHARLVRATADIEDLTRLLREVLEDRRDRPLRDIVLDRPDALGDLSRVIHDALQDTIAYRMESRMHLRNMDDRVQRRTHRATLHLQKEASTDALTGLGNRRALGAFFSRWRTLTREEDRDRRMIAMSIDMDRFKAVNDTLGHEVGDSCLTFLASLLKSGLRREDCAVRLGGDEFVVLMPDRSLADARTVAERLSSLFNQMPWPHAAPPRPGLSIGLASAFIGDLPGPEELIRRADAALYASKRAGRATITNYEDLRGAA